jgi:hypothetical protein
MKRLKVEGSKNVGNEVKCFLGMWVLSLIYRDVVFTWVAV